jgi:hypothetical protein
MLSFGAAICLGFGLYGCWLNRDIARALGGSGEKAQVLGVVLPYPMAMTLLAVFCLLSAFAAIYALFFPAQSPMET